MSNTRNKAEREFEILEKTVEDAIIVPFKKEILALVDKFGESGQSGGSAPYTASAISQTVKSLCMQETIAPITGDADEWGDANDWDKGDPPTFQNKRLSSVFKKGKDGHPYYLDAIVFKGQNGSCWTGNGSTKLKDGSIIKSRQFIKLPFKPKTFYIDVIETEWADKEELVEKEGGGWWTSVVKDESQLDEVWEYYERYMINKKKDE